MYDFFDPGVPNLKTRYPKNVMWLKATKLLNFLCVFYKTTKTAAGCALIALTNTARTSIHLSIVSMYTDVNVLGIVIMFTN